MDIKPPQIIISTPCVDKPIVIFLWSTIHHLNLINRVVIGSDETEYLFHSTASNVMTLNDETVIYMTVKCGFDFGDGYEFASEEEIKNAIIAVFENLGFAVDALNAYEIGMSVQQIKTKMKTFAEKYLSHDAFVSLQYQHGSESAQHTRVLSHTAHADISKTNKEILNKMITTPYS